MFDGYGLLSFHLDQPADRKLWLVLLKQTPAQVQVQNVNESPDKRLMQTQQEIRDYQQKVFEKQLKITLRNVKWGKKRFLIKLYRFRCSSSRKYFKKKQQKEEFDEFRCLNKKT